MSWQKLSMPIQLYVWMGKRYPLGNLSLFAANFSDKLRDITDVQLHQNQWTSERPVRKAETLRMLWIKVSYTIARLWGKRRSRRGRWRIRKTVLISLEVQLWVDNRACREIGKAMSKARGPGCDPSPAEQSEERTDELGAGGGGKYEWGYFLWIRCELPRRQRF